MLTRNFSLIKRSLVLRKLVYFNSAFIRSKNNTSIMNNSFIALFIMQTLSGTKEMPLQLAGIA